METRLVRDEAGPGLHAVEFEGETLHLERDAVLSDRDFETVLPCVRPDQLFLRLELTLDGTERVTSVTAAESGSRLAILVDSEVRSIPVIRSEIRGPRAGLMIPATESEAERLAALVRARWPLAPLVSGRATYDLEGMSIESHTAPVRVSRHPDV